MVWWKDIDLTLEKKNNGDIRDFMDEEAIMESIKNIFSTIRGERVRLPEFAVNLYEMLFEPIDEFTAREMGELIFDAISKWEKRVTITDLLVRPNPREDRFDIVITFSIRGVQSPSSFTIEDTIDAV